MFLRKKILIIFTLMVISIFSLSFGVKATTITLASSYEQEHIDIKAANKFKEIVEDLTDIEVNVLPGGSMGNEEQICEQESTGAVEAQVGGGMPMKNYAPKYYFFDTPFILNSWEHWQKVWNSKLGEEARELVAERGNIKYLGTIYVGSRHVTSSKPIHSISDFEGLKLRLPQLPSWVKTWKEIGVKTVPVSLTELFTSLQTGVAQASEGPAQQVYSAKLNEVQDYYIITGHQTAHGALTINKEFFESLSLENQRIIESAGELACAWASKKSLKEEEKLIEKLSNNGMEIIRPDGILMDLQKKAEPAIKELLANDFPVTTLEEIRSFAD